MEKKDLILKCQSNPKKEISSAYHTISVVVGSFYHWIVLESSSFHQEKVIKATVSQIIKQNCNTEIWLDKRVVESVANQIYWKISIAFTATLFSILQTVLFHNQWMSTKKQISSLCKLYSVYEEIPEEFLVETDLDSYFYHNFFDISQSHHRIVRVSKGSNKKSFAFKVFHFCDSKLQQWFILKEEVSISKREIESLLDILGDFLKASDQANKVSQIPLPKHNIEIGFTKAKDELFSHFLQGYSWAFKQTN